VADLKLTVRSKGAGRAALDLTEAGQRAGDVRPALHAVAPLFQADEKKRFERQGPRWPPPSPETVARKQREGLPAATMIATGRLYRSLTTDEGIAPNTRQLVFGTDVFYARIQQLGSKKSGGHLPRRKVIQLSKKTRDEMVDKLTEYVTEDKRR